MENGEDPDCIDGIERTDNADTMIGLNLVIPLTPFLLRLHDNNRHRELDDL